MDNKNNNSDFSNILNSAVSTLTGAAKDLKDEFNEKILSYLQKMDLVKREEFEVMRAMLEQSRLEQELMKKRLNKLEEELIIKSDSKKKPAAKN
ncbi:MAG: accessory factor UbiK family protein [Rickettsiales bacterium]